MATNISGLTYYKLDANLHGYPGDITKNCALRGEEVDGNFNFLRGKDIKELSIDGKGNLYLTRYDGEIIVAQQPEQDNENFLQGQDIKEVSFDDKNNLYLTKYNGDVLTAHLPEKIENQLFFDEENGLVTLVTPEGTRVVLNETAKADVFHDYSINGDGSKTHPLSVSNIIRTGHYVPAIKLVDGANNLPKTNVAKHDRYVTKEHISRFGKLYPSEAINAINSRLNEINSAWRIPTKEDWDVTLNAIDCVVSNHNSPDSNVDLGEFAGSSLKSTQYWEKSANGKLLSNDTYGFSVLPVGYCGNRGKDFYGSFGKSAAFWTATEEDSENDMFVKVFDYNKETIAQHTWGGNYLLSLRLVKDFSGDNFNDTEYIDGSTYNCVQIPGTTLVWTRDNVAFDNESYKGFEPAEWAEYENAEYNVSAIRYFINEWNGSNWEKQEIREGESIVLYEGEYGNMHKWQVLNGELVDVDAIILDKFNNLHYKIDNEIEVRISNDDKHDSEIKSLGEHIDAETLARENADAQLQINIDAETLARENADTQLQINIDAETAARKEEYEKLLQNNNNTTNSFNEQLANEIQARENADEQLQKNIDDEASIRENAINELDAKIAQEQKERTESYEEITQALLLEKNERTEANELITGSIHDETLARTERDKQLHDDIFTLDNKVDALAFSVDNNIDAMVLQFQQAIDTLQKELDATKEELKQLKAAAITVIQGTDNEIKITRNLNTAIVGFADDAHFVAGA